MKTNKRTDTHFPPPLQQEKTFPRCLRNHPHLPFYIDI